MAEVSVVGSLWTHALAALGIVRGVPGQREESCRSEDPGPGTQQMNHSG